jgi:hypothetical protein
VTRDLTGLVYSGGPRTGPWPQRYARQCTACDTTHELLVTVEADKAGTLHQGAVRDAMADRALVAERWLKLRAAWLCPECADAAHPEDEVFKAAIVRSLLLSGIEVIDRCPVQAAA